MSKEITETEAYKRGFRDAIKKAKEREEEKRAAEQEARLKRAEEFMLKRRKGAQDLRSGGMVVSTVNNLKNK